MLSTRDSQVILLIKIDKGWTFQPLFYLRMWLVGYRPEQNLINNFVHDRKPCKNVWMPKMVGGKLQGPRRKRKNFN
jgi:hypothetical protein